jgi:hypothetical protein
MAGIRCLSFPAERGKIRVGQPLPREGDMAKTPTPKKPAATSKFSLKVTLRDIKPPIWRRIVVPGRMTLGELHVAIQVTMGWQHCHLHAFDVAGMRYGEPGTMDDVASENKLTIGSIAKSGLSHFDYTYDFGDDWRHDILIEKTLPANSATDRPTCVAGKRNCPPEDCGGPWGYCDLLDILADPSHPQHEERCEWLGDEFDPEAFSIEAADAALAGVFNRKKPAKSAQKA